MFFLTFKDFISDLFLIFFIDSKIVYNFYIFHLLFFYSFDNIFFGDFYFIHFPIYRVFQLILKFVFLCFFLRFVKFFIVKIICLGKVFLILIQSVFSNLEMMFSIY